MSLLGVAITTRNRREIFNKTYGEWKRFLPSGAILVVIDDASTDPAPGDTVVRFETQQGIARAKNACIAALMDAGVDHLYLADDDCYPLQSGWERPYCESAEPHLMYLFRDPLPRGRQSSRPAMVYNDGQLYAYTHPRGCLLYMHRSVIERVGGMRPEFGIWGHEHVEYSLRVHAAGLTTCPFQDIAGSQRNFYSFDEHIYELGDGFDRAVPLRQRTAAMNANGELLERFRGRTDFVPYTAENVVITTLLTSRPDPQRHNRLRPNLEAVKTWRTSLRGASAVVLTDEIPTGDEVVQMRTGLQPYLQRWVSLYHYLRTHRYNWVFSTDGTDVEMLHEPWDAMVRGRLYVGFENTVVNIPWMRQHHPHYRQWIADNGRRQLLNAGVVGGDYDTVLEFAAAMVREIMEVLSAGGRIDGDMASFNKVAHSWEGRVEWGNQWVTPFKADQRNDYSAFKHK